MERVSEEAQGGAPSATTPDLSKVADFAQRLREAIAQVVVGQDEVVDLLLCGLFARGHSLLEGPPGTAKTLLAQSFAAALKLDFGRIQFTPDLMPGDVLGTNLFDFSTNAFRLTKGPVFTSILLADEINRAPPKTQAALLQVMNERFVTLDGTDYDMPPFFTVLATQNPIEQQGTYPLPEAQLDRFLFKILLDFPDKESEVKILSRHAAEPLGRLAGASRLEAVADAEQIDAVQAEVDKIRLDASLIAYMVDLVRATREDPAFSFGASTRAADALASATRALAALSGRNFAIPDDIKRLAPPVLRHRVVLSPIAEIEGQTADQVLAAILNRVEAPR